MFRSLQDIAAALEEDELAETADVDTKVAEFHMIGEIQEVNVRKELKRLIRYLVLAGVLILGTLIPNLMLRRRVTYKVSSRSNIRPLADTI